MSRGHHDSVPTSSTPAAPPPPYTEFAVEPSSSTSMGPFPSSQPSGVPPPRLQPTPMPSGPQPPSHLVIQHHAGYGPTPLASNQPLLPYAYYEARGSADARARLRFIGAFLCAFGLWLLVAFAVGVEVAGEEGWFRGNSVRKFWALDGAVRYWLWARRSDSAVEFAVA